jgi:recombination protein RecR
MSGSDIEVLIEKFARLPGLGPRSARRAVLELIKNKNSLLWPLIQALENTANNTKICTRCGNFDLIDPCNICNDPKRDNTLLCIVEGVADLWALERSGCFKGLYHITGGLLSAIDGIRPEDLNLENLSLKINELNISEVIMALSATLEGQTTAHYLAKFLDDTSVKVSGLARGIPVGGELDFLDDGTLTTALKSRRPL